MSTSLRIFDSDDRAFLEEMLYEAVFWRDTANRPSFREAMALPEVLKALAAFGERKGDLAVIADSSDRTAVGAAWLRYWTAEDEVRGFVDERIPVLAIGVKEGYRRRGIGGQLIRGLITYAADRSIDEVSLCVSKDNFALQLYRRHGFELRSDLGHSFTMTRIIKGRD
jgi:ribosomal protein S18 acetylase RimI-like enzyme